MKKVFSFFAKQGQHDLVSKALKEFGNPTQKPNHSGVVVSVELPRDVSKRFVDRLLFNMKIPGAVPRRNRFRVLKHAYTWDAVNKIGHNIPFMLSDGKKLRKMVVVTHNYCESCGPHDEMIPFRTLTPA